MITTGDTVLISEGGLPVSVGKCVETTARLARVRRNSSRGVETYLLATKRGRERPERTIAVIQESDADRIAAEIAERLDLERQEEDERRTREAKAAYDALPEAIKLARTLRWLCDCEPEQTIAEAPIEHLRGIVAWAKERELTTE